MIDLRHLDAYRDAEWEASISGGTAYPRDICGAFQIPSPVDRQPLRCMVSAGKMGSHWDHVSVSRADRLPWWPEMDYLARLFFRPNETVMQLHVPDTDHVNHSEVLHLWRPTGLKQIPRPPSIMVGPDSAKGRRRGR